MPSSQKKFAEFETNMDPYGKNYFMHPQPYLSDGCATHKENELEKHTQEIIKKVEIS